MGVSSYQMERVLSRLAEWFHWPGVRSPSEGAPLNVSPEARDYAQKLQREQKARGARTRAQAPSSAERKDLPPVVTEEIERRAGSFMKPPFPSSPRPSHVPRLRKNES